LVFITTFSYLFQPYYTDLFREECLDLCVGVWKTLHVKWVLCVNSHEVSGNIKT
jgi:hypothetical protein